MLAAAMGRTEKDVKISTVTFGERFVSPGVGRTAAMKIDVWCDNGPWSFCLDFLFWNPRTVRCKKIAIELSL
jgi:hypothetical protein